ncbi:MAG: DUF2889 domain-containing protein [Comamonadaceae bacterium]|nr:MAG: DUF2889 domain-containing protein [Comamonadaceae bacterium]
MTEAAVPRKLIHTRRIVCEGYEREDGLLDIEGTLTDTKPEPIRMVEKSLDANQPIHRMTVRLTIDRDRLIHAAAAITHDSPYRVCGDITASYGQLVGLRIEPGFTRTVKRMFRGTLGCSHMTELLPPMATVAFQMLWSKPDGFKGADEDSTALRSSPLGGCHALRVDGEVVKLHFQHLLEPQHRIGAVNEAAKYDKTNKTSETST